MSVNQNSDPSVFSSYSQKDQAVKQRKQNKALRYCTGDGEYSPLQTLCQSKDSKVSCTITLVDGVIKSGLDGQENSNKDMAKSMEEKDKK